MTPIEKRKYIGESIHSIESSDECGSFITRGLTKREYFAAFAMQGILSRDRVNVQDIPTMAMYAVKFSDALIKELEK